MVTVVEETIGDFRRNLYTFTNDFSNAAWLKIAGLTVTSDDTTGPDGAESADLLEANGNSSARLQRNIAAAGVNDGNHTLSYRIKPNDSQESIIQLYNTISGDNTQVTIDWTTETLELTSSPGAGQHLFAMRPADEYGFFKLVVTLDFTDSGGADNLRSEIWVDTNDGSGSLWVAQAQLEEKLWDSHYQELATGDDPYTGDYATIAAWFTAHDGSNPKAEDKAYVGKLLDGAHTVKTNVLVAQISNPNLSSTQHRSLVANGENFKPHTGEGPAIYVQWQNITGAQIGLHIDESNFRLDGIGIFDEDPDQHDPSGVYDLELVKFGKSGESTKTSNCFFKLSEVRVDTTNNSVITCVDIDGENLDFVSNVEFYNCIFMGGAHGKGCSALVRYGQFTQFGGMYNCDGYRVTGLISPGSPGGFTSAAQAGFGPEMINCRVADAHPTGVGDVAGFISGRGTLNVYTSDISANDPDPDTPNRVYVPAREMFRDPDAHDFRAPQASEAVDGGLDLTLDFINGIGESVDIEGTPRVAPWTIGAYEGFGPEPSGSRIDIVEAIGPQVYGRHRATIEDWLAATEGLNLAYRNERRIGELHTEAGDFDLASETLRARRTVPGTGRVRELRAYPDNRYDPIDDSGARIIGQASLGEALLHIEEDGFELSNIALQQSMVGSQDRGLLIAAGDDIKINAVVLLWLLGTSSAAIAADITGSKAVVTNTIVIGGGVGLGPTVGIRLDNGSISRVLHCVVDAVRGNGDAGVGFLVGTEYDRDEVQGCIATDCSTCFSVTGGEPGSIRMASNISSDASATGTSSQINVSRGSLFHLIGSYDYRNLIGSSAIKAGRNLGNFLDEDFLGSERRAPFDVGAYEGIPYVTFGGSPEMRRDELYTCKLYDVIRSDGVSMFATDANQSIPHGGRIYNPIGGVIGSASRGEVGLREGTAEFSGACIAGGIFDADAIAAGLFGDAKVIERTIDWRVPFMHPLRIKHYSVNRMRSTGRTWEADVSGPARAYQEPVGDVASPGCSVAFGSDECGIDLEALTITDARIATVVNDRREFDCNGTDVSSGFVDDYFGAGLIVWLTGDNVGTENRIKSYTQSNRRVLLAHRTAFAIQASDEYEISPGCRLRYFEDCITKWSNGSRHRGKPVMPTTDDSFVRA